MSCLRNCVKLPMLDSEEVDLDRLDSRIPMASPGFKPLLLSRLVLRALVVRLHTPSIKAGVREQEGKVPVGVR